MYLHWFFPSRTASPNNWICQSFHRAKSNRLHFGSKDNVLFHPSLLLILYCLYEQYRIQDAARYGSKNLSPAFLFKAYVPNLTVIPLFLQLLFNKNYEIITIANFCVILLASYAYRLLTKIFLNYLAIFFYSCHYEHFPSQFQRRGNSRQKYFCRHNTDFNYINIIRIRLIL